MTRRRWLIPVAAALSAGMVLQVFASENLIRPQPAQVTPASLDAAARVADIERQRLRFSCEPAFGNFRFHDPLAVMPFPDESGRMIVVERRGTVQMVYFRKDGQSNLTFLDIQSRVYPTTSQRADEGLISLAFHPEYADPKSPHRGKLFVYYVAWTAKGKSHRLARFSALEERIDGVRSDSEEVLIDQVARGRLLHGGTLLFGPDGFLYFSRGDERERFPTSHAQIVGNDLFSGVLRLDVNCRGGKVSHAPPRQPANGETNGYFIPNDNPFVGRLGLLEEFYAIGLRNPSQMSFDRETNRLIVTDHGMNQQEEINIVRAGSNCEWNYKEGSVSGEKLHAKAPERPEPYVGVETPPVFEYPRDKTHRCIIGGFVYRGKRFPELLGRYLYADQAGGIYALELDERESRAGATELIAMLEHPGIGFSSVGGDGDGEIYVCAIGELGSQTGQVYRLRRTGPE